MGARRVTSGGHTGEEGRVGFTQAQWSLEKCKTKASCMCMIMSVEQKEMSEGDGDKVRSWTCKFELLRG